MYIPLKEFLVDFGPILSKGQQLWECCGQGLTWLGDSGPQCNVIIGHVQEIVLGF